jgi:transcriptional regulator with GAF, ATPase, and Fis domain
MTIQAATFLASSPVDSRPVEVHDSHGMVGHSAGLTSVLKAIDTVARTDSTVLVRGETGTGKELVARAIHEGSERRSGPFVRVNCAAIPGTLLESELFGHERGAFTGAVQRRAGRFEVAHGGTIFLDEIGEMPIELQPKLLRVLQEREFERVGGCKPIAFDARVIAATHRDLHAMIDERAFRADLYYRLDVFPIDMPPLRERREDIPELVNVFVRRLARSIQRDIREVSSDSMAALVRYDWPGNIRELHNVLERAVILARGPVLDVTLAGEARFSPVMPPASDTLRDVERRHILAVLEKTDGVVGGPHGAAQRLGMKRSTLNFRMKKLGIVRNAN